MSHAIIGFNIPIVYPDFPDLTWKEKAIADIDDYFALCGPQARVLFRDEKDVQYVELEQPVRSKLLSAVKVLSYVLSVGIIPLIMVIAKAILRSTIEYRVLVEEPPKNDVEDFSWEIPPDSDSTFSKIEEDPIDPNETLRIQQIKLPFWRNASMIAISCEPGITLEVFKEKVCEFAVKNGMLPKGISPKDLSVSIINKNGLLEEQTNEAWKTVEEIQAANQVLIKLKGKALVFYDRWKEKISEKDDQGYIYPLIPMS